MKPGKKAVRDYNQGLLEAREAGKIEGREENNHCIAKNLLSIWFSVDMIAKLRTFYRNKSKHLKK